MSKKILPILTILTTLAKAKMLKKSMKKRTIKSFHFFMQTDQPTLFNLYLKYHFQTE